MSADLTGTTIRPATAADLAAVKAIYDHYIATSIATFDIEPSDPAFWRGRLERMYVAALPDGAVAGFAYASSFRPKAAYDATAETTIYLAPGHTGRGLGTRLYGALIDRLREDGFHTAIGVLAVPNPDSERLHESLGFQRAGVQREVGFKFGRYIDTVFYQLML